MRVLFLSLMTLSMISFGSCANRHHHHGKKADCGSKKQCSSKKECSSKKKKSCCEKNKAAGKKCGAQCKMKKKK